MNWTIAYPHRGLPCISTYQEMNPIVPNMRKYYFKILKNAWHFDHFFSTFTSKILRKMLETLLIRTVDHALTMYNEPYVPMRKYYLGKIAFLPCDI